MSNYTHDYAAEYLSLFNKNGSKRQISNAAVLQMIGAAPASHIDVHASDADYGHVMASSSNPAALGTANPGTSLKYAREDHVHPMPEISGSAETADFAKALKNPFMLYLEGAAVAEDRVDGVTDVHLRILKLDAQALEGLINLDNLPIGTESGTIAAGNHTHDYSNVYAAKSHEHSGADITSGTVGFTYLPTGTGSNQVAIGNHSHDYSGVYAASSHSHPYLPLAGGVMYAGSVISTNILETSGWYTGLVRKGDLTSSAFRLTTKIGITGTSLGDYCIRIKGYNTSNSSETIDIYVYLSNTTSGNLGQTLTAGRGWRSYGSLTPSALTVYGQDTNNSSCLSIRFTLGAQKTLVLTADFISHNLTQTGIVDSSSSSADHSVITGWDIDNQTQSGTQTTCNKLTDNIYSLSGHTHTSSDISDLSTVLSTALSGYSQTGHSHSALSAGSGLKYASAGQTYTGTDARTLSVDVGANFDWTGVHSFPNTTKINLTGVLIGKGSSSAIGAVSTSTNRQFLCYSTSGTAGYKFLAITKNDIPNVESLSSSVSAAGKILVSTGSGTYEWADRGRYIKHSFIRLTSSTVVTLSDHVAGTDQMVYLIIEPTSISTTDFYIKVPSPSTSIAGDKIQFVAIYNPTSEGNYTPIIHIVKNNSNDLFCGDRFYGQTGIENINFSSGQTLNLYCISYTVSSTTYTYWRPQKFSEISFDDSINN